MEGYTTSFINLITDNLRDRYDNGLPIIKELVQNADDAGARRLLIGRHEGFPDAKQPLLRSSGLWLFNNGGFKPSDKQALRAFGINAKAGDSTSIGKFGLGMKSVFHLCEALFYVAFDGSDHHHVGLTPWIQDGGTPHPEWNETGDRDWALLQSLAEGKVHDDDPSWFMLWIPLRRREQLARANGTETGAIIQRFPGDDPTPDLGFMSDARFGSDLAEMLPLLRHLEKIGYESADNPFEINLQCDSRLMVDNQEKASGEIVTDSGSIKFAGERRQSTDDWFIRAKQSAAWPKTRYRDENQQEHEASDKALPEAAAVFCSGTEHGSVSSLHWAVFLPLQQGGERLHIGGNDQHHNLVLHGQFFVDSGRKKLHDSDMLANAPSDVPHGEMDDASLRRAWNQRLAQRVQAPLVLPALRDYTAIRKLSDRDSAALTEALRSSDWFGQFRSHACHQQAWVRLLDPSAKPCWKYINGSDIDRLRPVPTPPGTAPDRPWVIFPGLKTHDWLPFDASAPALLDGPKQWSQKELEQLFENIPSVFGDGPLMDYLAAFLENCAGIYRETGWFQNTLIALLRTAFADSTPSERNAVRQRARRLVAFIAPQKRLTLSVEVHPDALRGLWHIDAPILLVPRGFDADAHSEGLPPQETLVPWLKELNKQISQLSADYHGDLLRAIQQLLRTLPKQDLAPFLRSRRNLRVIRVTNALTAKRGAASFAELEEVHKAGRLLGFAQGLNDAARMGLAAPLARVLPKSNVWLVTAGEFKNLMPNGELPSAENPTACLEAIAKDKSGVLSGIAERKALLEHANDPRDSDIAIRGLRYALHGSPSHRDDDAHLWAPALNQHPVWAKLWGSLNPNEAWTLIDKDLIDAIPRSRLLTASIQEITAPNLLRKIELEGTDVPAPEDFNDSERDAILEAIEDGATWSRLTLHTTVDGTTVSADQPGVYLARSMLQEGDSLTQLATFIQPSENPTVASQQRRWLKPLDELGRIELALGAPSPAEFWLDIMNALADLGDESDWPFLQALRETSWLPTQYDATSAGEDVIDLDGALNDAAQRVTSEHRTQHGTVFVVPTDLKPEVQQHPAWPKLRRHAFATQDRGVERLAMVLEELPRYHIGGWHRQPAEEVIAFMTQCDELPGWGILHAAGQHLEGFDDAWRLLGPGLNHPLETRRLTSALEWLTSDQQDWPMRKETHGQYLANWAQQPERLASLAPGQLLASENQTWRPASQLCVGANGIDPDSVLDKQQASALGSRVTHAGAPLSRLTRRPQLCRQALHSECKLQNSCSVTTIFAVGKAPVSRHPCWVPWSHCWDRRCEDWPKTTSSLTVSNG